MTNTVQIVDAVSARLRDHYVFPEVAATIAERIAARAGDYPTDLPALAAAVTADLQSVNGDKHLRLIHHDDELPERAPGDDSAEWAAMTAWSGRTAGGIASVRHRPGNVSVIEIAPILFPVAMCGDAVTAAMTLVADSDALVLDLRGCLGGEPGMVAYVVSYLWDRDPAPLSGIQSRTAHTQAWTLPFVPGRRYGKDRPVYVLTSANSFSGAEALAFDLRSLSRATVVGERTRGGANPRESYRVHPHLEATIPTGTAVHPMTGGNWEGVGVEPDVATTAEDAAEIAYQLALTALGRS